MKWRYFPEEPCLNQDIYIYDKGFVLLACFIEKRNHGSVGEITKYWQIFPWPAEFEDYGHGAKCIYMDNILMRYPWIPREEVPIPIRSSQSIDNTKPFGGTNI